MTQRWGARTGGGYVVMVNVYDLSPVNTYFYSIGLGAYHSGVEINGREYTFAQGGGIFFHTPKVPPVGGAVNSPVKYRESFHIGEYSGGQQGLEGVLQELRDRFMGNTYHLVSRNCNHFSEALSLLLVPGAQFPAYVNRLAWFGSFVPCLIPNDEEDSDRAGDSQPLLRSSNATFLNNRKSATTPSFSGSGLTLSDSSAEQSSSIEITAEERRARVRLAALKRIEQNKEN